MDCTRQALEDKLKVKGQKLFKRVQDIEIHKETTFDQIDEFFAEVIAAAQERALTLKEEFLALESREKIRLEALQKKLEVDQQLVQQYSQSFFDYFNYFGKITAPK